jgi:hypothetical protein
MDQEESIKRNKLIGVGKRVQSRRHSFRGVDKEEWIKKNGSRRTDQEERIKRNGSRVMDQEKLIRRNVTEEEQIKRNRFIQYNYQTILYLPKILYFKIWNLLPV